MYRDPKTFQVYCNHHAEPGMQTAYGVRKPCCVCSAQDDNVTAEHLSDVLRAAATFAKALGKTEMWLEIEALRADLEDSRVASEVQS